MNTDDLKARKDAADALPSTPPAAAAETVDGDEEFRRWREEIDRKAAEENDAHVIALEADSGADIRALMETGQIRPRHVPRVELG